MDQNQTNSQQPAITNDTSGVTPNSVSQVNDLGWGGNLHTFLSDKPIQTKQAINFNDEKLEDASLASLTQSEELIEDDKDFLNDLDQREWEKSRTDKLDVGDRRVGATRQDQLVDAARLTDDLDNNLNLEDVFASGLVQDVISSENQELGQNEDMAEPASLEPPPASGWHKEAETPIDLNRIPMMEMGKEEELEPEVESWLDKVEKAEDVKLDAPVVQDDQVLVANADPVIDEELVVLPLTYEEVERGLHMKVFDSMRWLAEWCVRVAKLMGSKVRYREK